jgi:NADPH:quinone reductase-like Zn-dependent oxidoreductase
MRAAVYRGHSVELVEVERPVPSDGEVLVAVRAASINAPDWRLMGSAVLRRLLFARRKRQTPGADVAGVVETVGRNVTGFKAGDAVFGAAPGSFAEYVTAREDMLLVLPQGATFDEAACIAAAGITALQALRDRGNIAPGQKVLINGASGSVGTMAVQIAKSFGAHVTAVCSTHNVDMVRSLRPDRVIDYNKEDFTKEGHRYDVILDNVGNRPLLACRRLLTKDGRFVMVGAPKSAFATAWRTLSAFVLSRLDKRVRMFIARLRHDDLAALGALMRGGQLKPVIDRTYSLEQVADALRYVSEGHARAKVVIKP